MLESPSPSSRVRASKLRALDGGAASHVDRVRAPGGERALLRAMRPEQWVKNAFVLAPVAFASGDRIATTPIGAAAWTSAVLATASFCLAASAVYLVNDVFDLDADRAHPKKRLRPIAAGLVSVRAALVAAAALVLCALAISATLAGNGLELSGVVGGYVLLNVAYGRFLKRVVLLDVFCIAFGFLLRIEAGGLAAGVAISNWMLLCTFFLALFLAASKRRAELQLLGEAGRHHRATLGRYSVEFIDQLVAALAACTIVFYALYTLDPQTSAKFDPDQQLVWSVPFVAFGIGRYLYLVKGGEGGNPTRLASGGDGALLATTLLWLVAVAAAMACG